VDLVDVAAAVMAAALAGAMVDAMAVVEAALVAVAEDSVVVIMAAAVVASVGLRWEAITALRESRTADPVGITALVAVASAVWFTALVP